MNEVSLDNIINLVVKAVVDELAKRGIKVVNNSQAVEAAAVLNKLPGVRTRVERIDMSAYKTPVLTELQLQRLHELTGEIVIPNGTVITPKAKEMIRSKGLIVNKECFTISDYNFRFTKS